MQGMGFKRRNRKNHPADGALAPPTGFQECSYLSYRPPLHDGRYFISPCVRGSLFYDLIRSTKHSSLKQCYCIGRISLAITIVVERLVSLAAEHDQLKESDSIVRRDFTISVEVALKNGSTGLRKNFLTFGCAAFGASEVLGVTILGLGCSLTSYELEAVTGCGENCAAVYVLATSALEAGRMSGGGAGGSNSINEVGEVNVVSIVARSNAESANCALNVSCAVNNLDVVDVSLGNGLTAVYTLEAVTGSGNDLVNRRSSVLTGSLDHIVTNSALVINASMSTLGKLVSLNDGLVAALAGYAVSGLGNNGLNALEVVTESSLFKLTILIQNRELALGASVRIYAVCSFVGCRLVRLFLLAIYANSYVVGVLVAVLIFCAVCLGSIDPYCPVVSTGCRILGVFLRSIAAAASEVAIITFSTAGGLLSINSYYSVSNLICDLTADLALFPVVSGIELRLSGAIAGCKLFAANADSLTAAICLGNGNFLAINGYIVSMFLCSTCLAALLATKVDVDAVVVVRVIIGSCTIVSAPLVSGSIDTGIRNLIPSPAGLALTVLLTGDNASSLAGHYVVTPIVTGLFNSLNIATGLALEGLFPFRAGVDGDGVPALVTSGIAIFGAGSSNSSNPHIVVTGVVSVFSFGEYVLAVYANNLERLCAVILKVIGELVHCQERSLASRAFYPGQARICAESGVNVRGLFVLNIVTNIAAVAALAPGCITLLACALIFGLLSNIEVLTGHSTALFASSSAGVFAGLDGLAVFAERIVSILRGVINVICRSLDLLSANRAEAGVAERSILISLLVAGSLNSYIVKCGSFSLGIENAAALGAGVVCLVTVGIAGCVNGCMILILVINSLSYEAAGASLGICAGNILIGYAEAVLSGDNDGVASGANCPVCIIIVGTNDVGTVRFVDIIDEVCKSLGRICIVGGLRSKNVTALGAEIIVLGSKTAERAVNGEVCNREFGSGHLRGECTLEVLNIFCVVTVCNGINYIIVLAIALCTTGAFALVLLKHVAITISLGNGCALFVVIVLCRDNAFGALKGLGVYSAARRAALVVLVFCIAISSIFEIFGSYNVSPCVITAFCLGADLSAELANTGSGALRAYDRASFAQCRIIIHVVITGEVIRRCISRCRCACTDTDTKYCREQQSYREQYLPYAFDRMHGLSMRESRNFLHFLSFLLKFLCTMITPRAAFATGHAQTHVVLSRRAGLRFGACRLPQISLRSFSRRGPTRPAVLCGVQTVCPLGLCCFPLA